MSNSRVLSDEEKHDRIESVYRATRWQFPDIPEVTASHLRTILKTEGIVLVDVRTRREQEVSMLPGAITSEDFEARRTEFEGAKLVAYCTIGHRSGLLVKSLAAQGWDASNLVGSVLAWTHVGGDFECAQGRTRRVHVFSPQTNLVAEGYEGVW